MVFLIWNVCRSQDTRKDPGEEKGWRGLGEGEGWGRAVEGEPKPRVMAKKRKPALSAGPTKVHHLANT